MTKTVFAAVLAASLISAPLPAFTLNAPAPIAAPDKTDAKAKKPASAAMDAVRERQKMWRRMEASQERRQGREGNEVAAILERLQQAAQGRELIHFTIKKHEGVGETFKFRRRPLSSFEPGRLGATALRSSHRDAHRPV